MLQNSFSIVVVCLNPGEKLTETVNSILSQQYGNYEIIIKTAVWKSCLQTAASGCLPAKTAEFMMP